MNADPQPALRKEYIVPSPKARAFMVEDAQWERIERRVRSLESRRGLGWLLSVSLAFFGVGISALLALLVLPSATAEGTELAAGVRPVLWSTGLGAVVLSSVLAAVYWLQHRDRENWAADICDEMETIQQAWKERRRELGA